MDDEATFDHVIFMNMLTLNDEVSSTRRERVGCLAVLLLWTRGMGRREGGRAGTENATRALTADIGSGDAAARALSKTRWAQRWAYLGLPSQRTTHTCMHAWTENPWPPAPPCMAILLIRV